MKKEIVISEKFKTRFDKLDIFHQEVANCKQLQHSGYIKKLEDDLYVLFKTNGSNGVGILDAATFWQAVLATEIATFWDYNNKALLN